MKKMSHPRTPFTLPSLSALKWSNISMSWLPQSLRVVLIILCLTSVQARWCTRLVTYTTFKTTVVESTCNQSYQDYCSIFSFEMCTQYETVRCMVEQNETVLQYRIVESCCPGFTLNPINNATCMSTTEEVHNGRVHVYNSKSGDKLFGLTNGAYAGIVCTGLFLICVIILVAVRVHKRSKNAKLKAQEQAVEMESAQKMITNPQV